jgi:predicted transcriptional regulator
MLKVMLGKKLVKRGEGEGSPVWEAAVSHAKTNTGLVQDLIKRVFDGSSKNLILHLLETETLSDKDQQTIHKMLAKAAPGKKRKRGKPS